jgi:hypothetical protein
MHDYINKIIKPIYGTAAFRGVKQGALLKNYCTCGKQEEVWYNPINIDFLFPTPSALINNSLGNKTYLTRICGVNASKSLCLSMARDGVIDEGVLTPALYFQSIIACEFISNCQDLQSFLPQTRGNNIGIYRISIEKIIALYKAHKIKIFGIDKDIAITGMCFPANIYEGPFNARGEIIIF